LAANLKSQGKKVRPIRVTLSAETVETIHRLLCDEFATTSDPISPPGLRDIVLLESAISRQHTGSGDQLKYHDAIQNVASLMYGLCNNHPFFNGNKRTALVAGLVHLDQNGFVLTEVDQDDLYRLMRRIASHHYSKRRIGADVVADPDTEVQAITSWLESHCRTLLHGEKPITYRQLYDIVEGFGYRLGDKRHNHIEILKKSTWLFGERWRCVHKIPCPGDSRIATMNEIKTARKVLNLTHEDGVDSYSFYGEQTVINSFIVQHRSILKRLAKT